MKKLLSILVLIAAFGIAAPAQAQNTDNPTPNSSVMFKKPDREQMKKEFEQRLNLSDKQKEKAKKIHQQGRDEIKPIMMQIDVKRREIQTVKMSKLSEEEQNKKIEEISSQIKDLNKQAKDIRKKNTDEFEKILNKKQKAELDKMKAEGRAKFEQHHPPRAPFQGLGSPNLFLKPILPPQN